MKKNTIILLFLLIGLVVGIVIFSYIFPRKKVSNNTNNFGYNSTRVSSTNDDQNNNTQNSNITSDNTPDKNSNTVNENSNELTTPSEPNPAPQENSIPTSETLISEFTTKIYTKDRERQNNISITCSSLNGTTVKNGDTFSFTATVGKSTLSKGYKKADVFKDGEVVQALGGGNCQVSTTLYNAVLKVDGLKVTERHSHSNTVPYIAKGKDAAVAFGSYDFKFLNNTGNTIKIESSCDKNHVYAKILKIE